MEMELKNGVWTDLRMLCEAVLVWAETPGDHGGNPYCHEHVQWARNLMEKYGWERVNGTDV
jgi:hypothetical protein